MTMTWIISGVVWAVGAIACAKQMRRDFPEVPMSHCLICMAFWPAGMVVVLIGMALRK